MAALVVPQAGILRVIWGLAGVPYAVNVYGVVNAGNVAFTQTLANTIGSAVKSGLTSSGLSAAVQNTVSILNVGLRDIRTANQPEFLDTGAAVAGTAAGDLLPPQTAFCVTLRTPLAGRSFRGRSFIPGFCETFNNATGAASGTTAAPAYVTAIKSALVSSGLDLGVLSRPRDTPGGPVAGHITAVTSIQARDAVWDTQRRRAIPGI